MSSLRRQMSVTIMIAAASIFFVVFIITSGREAAATSVQETVADGSAIDLSDEPAQHEISDHSGNVPTGPVIEADHYHDGENTHKRTFVVSASPSTFTPLAEDEFDERAGQTPSVHEPEPAQISVPTNITITTNGVSLTPGSSTNRDNLVVSWNAVESALRYEVRITTPNGIQTIIVDGTSFDATGRLSASGRYEFAVRAIGEDTVSTWSTSYVIFYSTVPPRLTITTPQNAVSSTTPLIIRGTTSGAQRMTVRFSRAGVEDVVRDVMVQQSGDWQFEVTRTLFPFNGTYTMAVTAFDAFGNVTTSSIIFTLVDPPIVVPAPSESAVRPTDSAESENEQTTPSDVTNFALPNTLSMTQQRIFSVLGIDDSTVPLGETVQDDVGNDLVGGEDLTGTQTNDSESRLTATMLWVGGGIVIVAVASVAAWLMYRGRGKQA